jgi:hypothetical protein
MFREENLDVAYWHLASFAALQKLVAYWSNKRQTSVRSLNSYAANDPKQKLGKPIGRLSAGAPFDEGYSRAGKPARKMPRRSFFN